MSQPTKDTTTNRKISNEIIIACITFALAGGAAWSNVKSAISVLETKAQTQEQHYEDLKEGQKDIQKLLNRLLLEKSNGDRYSEAD